MNNKEFFRISNAILSFSDINEHMALIRNITQAEKYIRVINIYDHSMYSIDNYEDRTEHDTYYQCLVDDEYYIARPVSRFDRSCMMVWPGQIKRLPFDIYKLTCGEGIFMYRDIFEGRWITGKSFEDEAPPRYSLSFNPILKTGYPETFKIFNPKMFKWNRQFFKGNLDKVKEMSASKKTDWSMTYYYPIEEKTSNRLMGHIEIYNKREYGL